MPETSTELATIDPKVAQQLKVVTEAIKVSLAVREVTVDFAKRKEELTVALYEFTKPPTNDEEQEEIKLAKRAVAKLRTEFDKKVDFLKSPLNAALDAINATKKTQIELLKECERHGDGLINNYQQKLTDARRADEARIESERKRIADQQAQAQREQEEAERIRRQAELAQESANRANTAAAREEIQKKADALAEEAMRLESEAYGKFLDAESTPIPPAAPSAPAPQAKEIVTFTVNGRTDSEKRQNLIKFFRAHEEFFASTIHEETPRAFTLTLKIKDLQDAINGVPPFAKLEGAPGITLQTRLSTLR